MMRKLRKFTIYGMVLCALSILGCAKDFTDDIDDLKNRVTSLEAKTTQINDDINNIQDIINARNEQEQIHSVDKLSDNNGYKITFSKNGVVSRTIEITNGTNGTNGKDAPIIGTARDTDGKYYWNKTVNGTTEWLLDAKGSKIPLTGAVASAPTIGVDAAGYWTIDLHDGNGIKRMKDATGKDVKAIPTEGGTVGFRISADGRYAIFTIAGKDYSFEIAAITIGLESYETVFIEKGKSATLTIVLPANLKKEDFSAIQAKIEDKNGISQDVVTRAVDESKWLVSLIKQTYNNDGTINESPKAIVTAPTTINAGNGALLTISLLDNNGKTFSVSRAFEIIDVTTVQYTASSNIFTLETSATDRPKNISINVNSNLTDPQTIIIPTTYTKANTPFIILCFAADKSFSINNNQTTALTIAETDYDGTIMIQGQSLEHNAIINDAEDGIALKVLAQKATVIAKNIKIKGTSDITVSPNTFVVSSASVANISMNSGSVTIESGATVTGNLVSKSEHPIVISGNVTGTITASSAPVEVKSGGTTNAINSAGVSVENGATVDGHIKSYGGNIVVIAGEVKGNVTASDAGKVEIGENAKINGNLDTNENANVVLPPSAEIGGEINIPSSSGNIVIGNTVYTTLDKAITASIDNDVITLKDGEYPITNEITKNISLKGAGVNNTTIKGEVQSSGNLVIEKLHVSATSNKLGKGAIHMTSVDAELTLRDAAVTQYKTGTSDGQSTSGIGVFFCANNDNSGEIKFTMIDSKINLNGKYQHGLNIDGGNESRKAIVNMTNSSIVGSNPTSSNDAYSRGISIGTVKSGSELTMIQCEIIGVYYPINTNSSGLIFNLNSSTFAGYCAVNLHGNNCQFNITNSTLTGRNYYNGNSSNFSTIMVNSNKTGNIFNLDGCIVTNVMTAECEQYMIGLKATGNTVNFIGAKTKLIDSQKDNSSKRISYMINVIGNNKITGLDNLFVEKSRFTALIAKMGGKGTIEDPINIYNATDFGEIGINANYPLSAHYVQICDIDMTEITNYNPIGKSEKAGQFTGVYDGGGYDIYNIAIDSNGYDYLGLFNTISVGGVVKNVNLTVNTTNPRKIIGIGSPTNVTGSFNQITIGSIAGRCFGTITNCTNHVGIIGYGNANNNIGGIVGCVSTDSNTAVIENCTNSGTISKIGAVGGIIGYIEASTTVTVSNCVSAGNLEGSKGKTNYIIGENYSQNSVTETNNTHSGTIATTEETNIPRQSKK